jgi:predicted TIM-barrel fold metal-dependent hydrolase
MSGPVIDAYAHVGMPRFLSVPDYLGVMERGRIDRAVLCSFDSSPDLTAIHDAISRWPERFRGLGVPLGKDRGEIEAAVHAQLSAGFSGLRLSDEDVRQRAWLLDIIAEHDAIAVVCGQLSLAACARPLLDHLERNAKAIVIGGHFAGGGEVSALADGPVATLFQHPRFHVVFSRHGGFSAAAIERWAEAVIARTGWDRILWGSEVPLLFWRNETISSAIGWIDRLSPNAEERAAFLGGNAEKLYFDRAAVAAPLNLPFEPQTRARSFPATILASGLPIEQSTAGRLVHAWLEAGGEGGLGSYIEQLIDRGLQADEYNK